MTILPHLEFYLRPLPGYAMVQPLIEAAALRQWNRTHRPPAPRSVKSAVVRRFAGRANRTTFVETGTFFGDMVAAVRDDFDRLYSIELHRGLGARAIRRFADDPRVSIVIGDSGAELEPLLRALAAPAVLWLDGHYSGALTARGDSDTPVLRELDGAFRGGTAHDVVLIDDARLFGLDPAYPTVIEVERRMRLTRPDWVLRVEDDIVQLFPMNE